MKNDWRVKIGRKHYKNILNYCQYKDIDIKKFNEPVIINPNCKDLSYLFSHCKSFNQPVVIHEGTMSCNHMFFGCSSFNQPITIPTTVNDALCMFTNCTNFNSPVTLVPRPNKRKVFLANHMFEGCKSFNQDIQDIVNYAKYSISCILNGCKSFNKPFILHKKTNKRIFDYYKKNNKYYILEVDTIEISHWYDFDKNYLNFYLYDIILLNYNENIYITCKENNKCIKLNSKHYSALLNLKNKLINFKDLKIEKNNYEDFSINIEIPVTTEEFAKISLEILLTD